MFVLRLYLVVAGLALAVLLLLGLLRRDPRWFRFAWQLFRFSVVLLVVVFALIALGRLILR